MTTGPGTGRLSTSEVARALLERPERNPKPSFSVERVKGVGGATVVEWHVTIPVCPEYPTAAAAFQAAIRFGDGFDLKYGPKDTLLEDLQASVEAQK